MKQLISIIILMLLFVGGCITPPSQQELAHLDYGAPPLDYETTIKRYFDDVLFDPYSAHYDFGTPELFWYKEAPLAGGRLYAGYLVRVGVNAKNRMGGYVGKKTYGFILKDKNIIKVLDEFELKNMKHFK